MEVLNTATVKTLIRALQKFPMNHPIYWEDADGKAYNLDKLDCDHAQECLYLREKRPSDEE